MMLEWLGVKNNDQNSSNVAKILEDVISDIIKSGVTTKDIGGTMTTRDFTNEIINKLSS